MNVSLPRGASANLPIISTSNEESSLDEDYVDSYLSVQSNVNTRTPTGLTILRRESTIFRRPKKTIEDILMEGVDVSYICDISLWFIFTQPNVCLFGKWWKYLKLLYRAAF